MVQVPSDHFVTLVATLFEALPEDGSSIQDEILLQLHAIFGSMLLSALQLIDRRDVVKVLLPNGRYLYQVTSATGSPYTLFASLPNRPPAPELPAQPDIDPDMIVDQQPTESSSSQNGAERVPTESDDRDEELDRSKQACTQAYIQDLKRSIGGMYCPCTGYGFNTLAGEKNIFCKHLLALILAHCMDRLIHTEVYLKDVVNLLGMASLPVDELPRGASQKQEVIH